MSPRVSPVRALTGAVLAGALLAGCAGGTVDGGPGAGDNRFVAGDGSIQRIKAADRSASPDASGTTLEGKKLALAGLRGKVVVVNFWASWCAPCRGEAPALEQIHKETKNQGVAFVGVAFKDARANAKAFERKFGITYPSLFDADGRITLAFRDVPPNAIPSTLVLDRQGRVAARIIGATTYSKLKPLVTDIAQTSR